MKSLANFVRSNIRLLGLVALMLIILDAVILAISHTDDMSINMFVIGFIDIVFLWGCFLITVILDN